MVVLSKCFTNIFWAHPWGGRNIDGVKLPFLFRDFVAPRVDPVGKNISQKTYNEKDIRENGKSGKKSIVCC